MSKVIKSVITCDLDGKVETFSDGASDLFGYSQEDIEFIYNVIYPENLENFDRWLQL